VHGAYFQHRKGGKEYGYGQRDADRNIKALVLLKFVSTFVRYCSLTPSFHSSSFSYFMQFTICSTINWRKNCLAASSFSRVFLTTSFEITPLLSYLQITQRESLCHFGEKLLWLSNLNCKVAQIHDCSLTPSV